MKKIITSFLLLISIFTNTAWGEIIEDASGDKFLTIGSTKDEVLEILGTPSEINNYLNSWYFGCARLSFDKSDRIKEYTNAKALKILLIPSKQKAQNKEVRSNSNIISSNNNNLRSSNITSNALSVPSDTYTSTSSGYGEISEKTGKPKTVHVNGYFRKDGTYVKSHYRSK